MKTPATTRRRDDRGFTLVELLVTMAIFSTVIVIASDIFLLSNRAQRELFGMERTQADARFTLEAIVREVRTGEINYQYYVDRGSPIAAPDAELALIDSTGTPIRFRVSDAGSHILCADTNSSPCLLVRVGSNAEQAITPRNVSVSSAKFYIAPAVDPTGFTAATGAYASSVQPHVTVSLILQSKGERAPEQSVVSVQTTATSRKYSR